MAAIPSQRTWSVGEVVTAAMLNDDVRDAITFFVSVRPKALLRQTVAQSLTNNVWGSITFDTEDHDNDTAHSTVTNTSRYTAVTAGWYRVSGVVTVASAGSGQRGARWAVNGTVLNASRTQHNTSAAGATDVAACGRLVFLSAGDYVELQGFQNSGGALNTAVVADEQSQMSITWEGS